MTTNRHDLPVLDRPRRRVDVKTFEPMTPIEPTEVLVISRCATPGCRYMGLIQIGPAFYCDVCASAAVVLEARCA